MKKFMSLLLIGLLIVTGCSNDNDKTKEDETLRVVSLAPSITETIIGMDMADSLVAVDTWSIFDETTDLPMLDSFNLNAEEVIKLDPDIILLPDYNYYGLESNFDIFTDSKIKVVAITGGYGIEDIYNGILEVGIALDNQDASEKLVQDTKDELQALQDEYADYERKTVYFEIDAEPTIYTVSSNTFLSEIAALVGGDNIFSDVENDYFAPSVESIIEKNPDFIFTNVSYVENYEDVIKNREGFENITAIKNGDVYYINSDYSSRPSHNMVIAAKEIAELLHGDEN